MGTRLIADGLGVRGHHRFRGATALRPAIINWRTTDGGARPRVR
ncbi:MAG: hypothetical protein ACRDTU_09230 [Micromonosporaceae bacterium]